MRQLQRFIGTYPAIGPAREDVCSKNIFLGHRIFCAMHQKLENIPFVIKFYTIVTLYLAIISGTKRLTGLFLLLSTASSDSSRFSSFSKLL